MKPIQWGELRNNKRNYPCHPYQIAVLESPARITFAFAGTGGGKSCIIPLWIYNQLKKHQPKSRILCVSPTYKIFKQSKLLDSFFQAVEDTEFHGRYHKTDSIYTCGNGSEIFFRSAEISDSLEGGQYQSLSLDECGKISYDSWIKASARVGASMGDILGVTTPDVQSWIYTDIYEKCCKLISQDNDGTVKESDDGSIRIVQWASCVNPIYSPQELARQKAMLRPELYARRYLGQFTNLDGLVYPDFVDNLIPPQDILPSPAVKVVGGIDWGWNDPCSVIVLAECQDGKVYLVEEIYESHLPLDRLAEKLHALKSKWLISEFYCDSSRPEIMNQLKKAGLPCRIKNLTSIEQGISLVDSRIRNGYLRCYDTLKNLISEMQQYARKPDRDNRFTEKPIDKMNHLCDALRYGICGLDFGRQLTFTQPTESDKQKTELESQIRIGQKPIDPEAQRIAEAAERKAAYAKHFWNLAFGDLED